MTVMPYTQARILIIDDQYANLNYLETVLRQAGYAQLCAETDPHRAVEHLTTFKPDLILLDLWMPTLDGFAVMDRLRPLISLGGYLPILVLTADVTVETKRRALASGARDFLTKPFDRAEVMLRIQNLLETRFLHLELARHNERLRDEVKARTRELEESRVEMLLRLSRAVEYRDDETGDHTQRVGETAARIAVKLGMSAEEVDLIRLAAPLHDLGKIGISDAILLKQGPLTAEEFAIMKRHTTIGAALLANGQSRLIQIAEQIALTHHERWDGNGYPNRLGGEAIPLVGRIVSVADVFDALTHARPYKRAWSVEEALDEMKKQSGIQFDPSIVAAFLKTEFVL